VRTLLAFLAGIGLALTATWMVHPPPSADHGVTASARATKSRVDEAAAVIVELDPQPGLPPHGGPVRPYDSRAARRQALARTLRDLERHPPRVEPGRRDPATEAVAGAAMRDALVRALRSGGDR